MSATPTDTTELSTESTEGPARFSMLRTAVAVGVASVTCLAVGPVEAAAPPARVEKAAVATRPVINQLTALEAAKDAKRVQIEGLLKELGGDIQIEWVKGTVPAGRRVIQMVG